MRTIAIENLKGGVGKTVTTISLARILAEDYQQRVLVVDCDGQCNLTRFYLKAVPDFLTLADVLEGTHEPYWRDNVVDVRPRLSLLPASPELYRLDLAAIRYGVSGIDALQGFVEAVAEDGEVDVVLFDCPPGFTAASTAALMAAREIIVPVLMDGFSIEGMADMLEQVESMRDVNPMLRVSGILINQWHRSPAVEQGEALLRSMPLPVFKQTIRRTDKVPESSWARMAVQAWSPFCSAARDYRAWVAELLEKEVTICSKGVSFTPNDFSKTVGRKIRDLRKLYGLTQSELGDRIGSPSITVRQWEAGKRLPKLHVQGGGCIGRSGFFLTF